MKKIVWGLGREIMNNSAGLNICRSYKKNMNFNKTLFTTLEQYLHENENYFDISLNEVRKPYIIES